MIPIRDENPNILVPYATISIIVINCLAWVFVQGMGTEPALSNSVCVFALVPGELLGVIPPGAYFPAGPDVACQAGAATAWHTLITSMFMHGGWLHLLGNMWFLWIFGNNVEDAMGPARFIIFYVLCGLLAAALQIMLTINPELPMVGASGAIGGVMGAYILLYPRVKVILLIFLGFFVTTISVPAILMLGYWFLLQLLGGLSSVTSTGGGVAFWAHIGGFVGGAILVNLFRDRELLNRHPYHGWRSR